jgi:hypothetical protein
LNQIYFDFEIVQLKDNSTPTGKKLDVLTSDQVLEYTVAIEKEVILISALQLTDFEVMQAGKELNQLTIKHNETESMIINDEQACMQGIPHRSGRFAPLTLLVPDIRHQKQFMSVSFL